MGWCILMFKSKLKIEWVGSKSSSTEFGEIMFAHYGRISNIRTHFLQIKPPKNRLRMKLHWNVDEGGWKGTFSPLLLLLLFYPICIHFTFYVVLMHINQSVVKIGFTCNFNYTTHCSYYRQLKMWMMNGKMLQKPKGSYQLSFSR